MRPSRVLIEPATPDKFSAPSPVTPAHSAQYADTQSRAFIGLPGILRSNADAEDAVQEAYVSVSQLRAIAAKGA